MLPPQLSLQAVLDTYGFLPQHKPPALRPSPPVRASLSAPRNLFYNRGAGMWGLEPQHLLIFLIFTVLQNPLSHSPAPPQGSGQLGTTLQMDDSQSHHQPHSARKIGLSF